MADSANEEPVLDRNGFVVASADSTHVAKGLTAADIATIRRHEIKWMGMLNDWDTWMLKRPGKIKSRCRKGIPDSLRGRIWARLTGADELMAANPGLFAKLAATEVAPDDPAVPFLEVIDKDLHRTFPDHVMFTKSGFGQGDMRDVLKAYALHNPTVGYCQGMGFVAGLLLMQLPAEQAFWTLAALLDSPNYLKGVYDSGLREVQIAAAMMDAIFVDKLPALGSHLQNEGMQGILFMTDWFMCVFIKTLQWDCVLRIWDMFLFEGVKVVFRTALAIMTLNQERILAECKDLGALMQYLRNLPPDMLLEPVVTKQLLKTRLRPKELAVYRESAVAEYERTHPPKKEQPVLKGRTYSAPATSGSEYNSKGEVTVPPTPTSASRDGSLSIARHDAPTSSVPAVEAISEAVGEANTTLAGKVATSEAAMAAPHEPQEESTGGKQSTDDQTTPTVSSQTSSLRTTPVMVRRAVEGETVMPKTSDRMAGAEATAVSAGSPVTTSVSEDATEAPSPDGAVSPDPGSNRLQAADRAKSSSTASFEWV